MFFKRKPQPIEPSSGIRKVVDSVNDARIERTVDKTTDEIVSNPNNIDGSLDKMYVEKERMRHDTKDILLKADDFEKKFGRALAGKKYR